MTEYEEFYLQGKDNGLEVLDAASKVAKLQGELERYVMSSEFTQTAREKIEEFKSRSISIGV